MNRDFVQVGKGFPELKAWALAWLLQIRELYGRNRNRLRHVPGSTERAAAESALRDHVANMAVGETSNWPMKNCVPRGALRWRVYWITGTV